MKRKQLLLLLSIVIFTLGACAQRKVVQHGGAGIVPFGEQDLDGEWILTRAYSEGAPGLTGADLKGMTLTFNRTEHRITGKAACNRYFGNYTATNKAIHIGDNIGSTRMMCDRLETETAYLKQLPRVNSYRFLGHNDLELRRDGLCMFSLRRVLR